MHANPSSLDTPALAACLRASAGEERDRQVDFLRYLDPFDSREAWREAGYGSLWQFCLRELSLREGAAGRRIGAMRVLRELPGLEAPLRDGRLSLTTAVTLRPVLTRENLEEIVARAAYKTDEETRYLVATLAPRPAPKEGIRRLPGPAPRLPASAPGTEECRAGGGESDVPLGGAEASSEVPVGELEPFAPAPPARPPSRPSLEPVSANKWSMRVTIGKRRGAVKPERQRKPAALKPRRPGEREPIPAEVRRAVWERDGGRCTYVSPDGRRCESRWQVEYDHIKPAALGGPSTVANGRLRCKSHNDLHAEETFGRAHMAPFRRRQEAQTGKSTLAGERRLPVIPAAASLTTPFPIR